MFQVGQKVVCVDDGAPRGWSQQWLRLRAVYTVRAIAPWGSLYLEEVVRENDKVPFRASRFRPVVERKTDISIFQKMLTPSPERVN